MASNGNGPLTALEQIAREAPPPLPPAQVKQSDIMSIAASLAERCRNTGRTLAHNGAGDSQDAQVFADHLLTLFRKWASELVARKRQELTNLERFLGEFEK